MKNEMSTTSKKNDVIDLAPHLPASRMARPRRQSKGTVIPLRAALPDLAPIEAQTPSQAQSGMAPAPRHGFGRTLSFLKRLLARIDVTDFPGSCCG
jgi:hypothetical protein